MCVCVCVLYYDEERDQVLLYCTDVQEMRRADREKRRERDESIGKRVGGWCPVPPSLSLSLIAA